jgi:hypothetical protein
MPIATFINMLAVLLGGSIGLLLGARFPERIKQIVFQGIGLATLVIGMRMSFGGKELLLMIFALILGGILGEWLQLDERTQQLGEWLRKRLKSGNERFAEGLTTTFLIFCVGSMTIVGAINEGISGDRTLLLTKSVMDGFTAIALATIYGSSVLFSVVPMLIFQGGITLLAYRAQYLFNEALIAEMGAVGGVLIIGIGINILGIKQIKVLNLLPALLFMVLLVWAFGGRF